MRYWILFFLCIPSLIGWSSASSAPLPKYTVNGFALGTSIDDVRKLLGPPLTKRQDATVTPEFPEFRTAKPDLNIRCYHGVVAYVCGDVLEKDGRVLLKANSTAEEVRAVLGEPARGPDRDFENECCTVGDGNVRKYHYSLHYPQLHMGADYFYGTWKFILRTDEYRRISNRPYTSIKA